MGSWFSLGEDDPDECKKMKKESEEVEDYQGGLKDRTLSDTAAADCHGKHNNNYNSICTAERSAAGDRC